MGTAPENRPAILYGKDAGWRGNARAAWPYAAALAAGLVLRIWMLTEFFQAYGDTYIYGGLAKNLLEHGIYSFTRSSGAVLPTLIRLPGYPLFLVVCFKLFGMENYGAVAYVQIALDLAACLLVADFARRVAPPALARRAGLATLWLAALCPFTASYACAGLTETATLFALALAMWAMVRFRERPGWTDALWFTFAVTFAAMLRPDGALAAVAFVPALVTGLPKGAMARGRLGRMAGVCVILAVLPFAAWTWRNWKVFHVFQPLAPRYATDPGEQMYPGWEKWFRTWSLDWVSTNEVYWNVPQAPLEMKDLPDRAFDSPAQRARTAALAAAYEDNGEDISPELDAEFGKLAQERIRAHPLRYYVWLPLGRLADMILRPRIENLPLDAHWWRYARHPMETVFDWLYAGLNALYLGLGIAGLCLRPRLWKPLAAYLLLRCALLLTIGAPEDRYTLEFFPILFAMGGVATAAGGRRIFAASARERGATPARSG